MEKELEKYYEDAVIAVRQAGRGSTSFLQRKLRIGYFKASDLIGMLVERRVLKPKEKNDPKPYELETY